MNAAQPAAFSLRKAFFLSHIVLALSWSSLIDAANPVSIIPFAMKPAELSAIASSTQVSDEADVNVLDSQETYQYYADGSSTYTTYLVYKVITTTGAEGWSEFALEWSPWLEQRPAMRARIISADGNIYTLDQSTITDAPAGDNDTSIYTDRRKTRAPLPAVAPGSIIETEITLKRQLPFSGAGDLRRTYLQFNQPLQHSQITLRIPTSIKVRHAVQLLPSVVPLHTSTSEYEQWVFESGFLPPFDEGQEGIPNDTPSLPAVTFSTGSTWNELASSYSKIVNERITQSKVTELAARLTKGLSVREDKIGALLEYLNHEIRYTGVEFNQSSIFPNTPSETLNRKYGDCKDKSALLVALLRASGIPANLALLNVSDRADIESELPGFTAFDHAIVQVPGDPTWWIDATDASAKLGQLPDSDRNRFTLIIAENTTTLTKIPPARSSDNVDYQDREIYLADIGPARVIETSRPQGTYESKYRNWYGDVANKKLKETLTDYLKNEYVAEKMGRAERTDPRNFSMPFQLTLEATRAKRGYTNLNEAHVFIPLDSLFQPFPTELKTRQLTTEENAKATKPKPERTVDFEIAHPFVTEWHYKIIPPVGFVAAALPVNTTVSIGPCLLTEVFSADPSGAVQVTLRFDSVRQRFTVVEQNAIKNKIADLTTGEMIKIKFDLLAKLQLADGYARDAFKTLRDLISKHPKAAIHHLRLADALLKVGVGGPARDHAKIAVKLEPKLALAHEVLADVLSHDLLGRKYLRGADLAGASAAYHLASSLDPDDKSLIANNAILLEYNNDGVRYGEGANLKAAIAEYQKLTVAQAADWDIPSNLAFALFYAGDFRAAIDNAKTLNATPIALIVASEAKLNGVPQALQEARRRTNSEAKFKEVVTTAGNMVMQMHDYIKAADLFEAGASGGTTSKTMALTTALRKTARAETMKLEHQPEDVVKYFLLQSMKQNFSITKFRDFASHNAQRATDQFTSDDVKRFQLAWKALQQSARKTGLKPEVLIDLSIQMAQFKVYGDDKLGYRVVVQIPGQKSYSYFVVKETAQYKILDSSDQPIALALEVLERLEKNDVDGAAALLEWLRDGQMLEASEDRFSGSPFTRFWLSGHHQPDAKQIKIAAAMLLAQQRATVRQGLDLLEELKPSIDNPNDIDLVELAIMLGYVTTNDYDKALLVSKRLSQKSPTSRRTFMIQSWSLRSLKRLDEALALAKERLQSNPNDIDAQRMVAEGFSAAGRYQDAYAQVVEVTKNSNSTAFDLNNLAWTSLFFDREGGPDVESAVRATQLAENSFAHLHTLACVYAELGKIKEAHDVLFQALDAALMDQPDENSWYVFGRIDELTGESSTALAHYSLISKPVDVATLPSSTYQLAQNRIRLLSPPTKIKVASTP